MNYKNNFIFLGIFLALINSHSYSTTKYDSELVVTGTNVFERVEGTLSTNMERTEHGTNDGKIPIRAVVWAENGATVHNIGSMKNAGDSYETEYGSILGIGGINNKLVKEDNFIVLRNNANLINDGSINFAGVEQEVKEIVDVIDFQFHQKFTDYTKNTLNLTNSNLKNTGDIASEGDHFKYLGYVSASIINYNEANFYKNVVLATGGKIENSGKITYERDYGIELKEYVNIDLINLGLHYNREVAGISTIDGTTIYNSGTISVGGDLLQNKNLNTENGVTEIVGLDLVGEHNKYGIKAEGGEITNSGIITIERDFSYALDEKGNIVPLESLYKDISVSKILSFKSFNEKSVGVLITNGNFINNGGAIEVGVNHRIDPTQTFDNAGIGIEANNSTIKFNKGKIELEGTQVWLANLKNNSTMTFSGDSEVILKTNKKNDVNKEIFGNDGTGKYIINGNLKVYGKKVDKEENSELGEEFDANVTLGEGSHIYIGVDKKENMDGEQTNQLANSLGKLEVSGKLDIQGDVKFDSSRLIGVEDLSKYKGNVIFSAKEISGGSNIESGTPIFTIKTINNGNQITVSDIYRNSFYDIVENKELGEIFETNYDTADQRQIQVYRYLAEGEGKIGFKNRINEFTGKDTLVTLNSQVYDITKDLNRQIRNFVVINKKDGLILKYINGKSKLEKDSSTVGFERKSYGSILGYNKYLNEKLRLGTVFSYLISDIDYTSESSNKIKTWSVGGYFNYDFNSVSIFSELTSGVNKSENKRFTTFGFKNSDLDVYTFSLNNSIYKTFSLAKTLSFIPKVNLDFTYLYQNSFNEEGVFGASANNIEAFYTTVGIGADSRYVLYSSNNNCITLKFAFDYHYDIISKTEDMNLKAYAFDSYYKESSRELDKNSLNYTIGINYRYSNSYSLGIFYVHELLNEVQNRQVGVELTYNF